MILNSYLECVSRGEFLLADVVRFEANSLTPTNVVDDMVEKLKTRHLNGKVTTSSLNTGGSGSDTKSS